MLEPDGADNQLQYPDGGYQKVELVELPLVILIQAVAEKYQRTDHRVHDVVGEGHLPHRPQPIQEALYTA